MFTWKSSKNGERKNQGPTSFEVNGPDETTTPFSPGMHPFYLIDAFEQGSDDWHRWRRRVVGASDAPIIMRENRWSSVKRLADIKIGVLQDFQGNDATREGKYLETQARTALCELHGIELTPMVVQDGEVPYFAASLDALNLEHQKVFEIKCGEAAYELASREGKIPRYYFGQLQHILMVLRAKSIVYAVYRPHRPIIEFEVARDDAYIRRLRESEHAFVSNLTERGHEMESKFHGSGYNREVL
jgi:putative phage-type endonuclease